MEPRIASPAHHPQDSAWSASASLATLVNLQSPSGAFIASPDFGQYGYCWLRDSSFIAYSLDLVGEHEASRRYHAWVLRTIGRGGIARQIEVAINALDAGYSLAPVEMPPARFSLDGAPVVDDWPNFQIDGYGTWLWSLGQHLELSGSSEIEDDNRLTVERTARYISTFAFEPCWDVWEENGTEIHTSTLASVQAGLVSASHLLADPVLAERASEIGEYLTSRAQRLGYFQKSSVQTGVDASTLWLASPFQVVPIESPLLTATVAQIESDLLYDGGVRRYREDTYFGGGAWPVLTCSLGSYYARAGRHEAAEECRIWTEAHFDEFGRLAEQFEGDRRDPENYQLWVSRWGSPAAELLWSHAMYVVLCCELEALF